MKSELPAAITAYYDAEASKDYDRLAALFSETGTVSDESHTYHGRAEIRAWKERVDASTPYTSEVLEWSDIDGGYHVNTRISGSFPNSPVTLTHRFSFTNGLIRSLEIS